MCKTSTKDFYVTCPLIQLQSWESDKLFHLFQSCTPRLLQVEAALIRQTPCTLYVDSKQDPQAAALQVAVCWYVVGYPSREFLQAINDRLPRDTYSVLVFGDTITEDQQSSLTQGMYFVPANSRYAERTNPSPITHPLATGYASHPIDHSLLSGHLGGIEDLRTDIVRDWQSIDAFEQHGFGFVAVHNAQIVGQSLSDYVCGNRCEIGIHTDAKHRLKGLGAHLASRTTNKAFERGLNHVGWMSWANNKGSIAVSEKAGFTETCQYEICVNHWPAGNPQDMAAGEFRAFANEYDRQFAKNPPRRSGYPHIVAATARALAGESDSCRRHLH
jgi:RimJ/RimL family protein N-acetyltransferase